MAQTNWTKTKKFPEGVDVVVENDSPTSIEFTAADGTRMRVRSFYGLEVYVAAPPPTEKKHRVSGSIVGVPVCEDFETSYEAEQRKRDLEQAAREAVELVVDEVEIPL